MKISKHYDTVTGYIFSPNHKKILLVKKRFSGRTMAPGGHVEYEETFSEALFREISEETGVGSERLERIKFTNRQIPLGEAYSVVDAQQDEDFIVIEHISPLKNYYDHIYGFVIDDTYLTHNKTIEISDVFWEDVSNIHLLDMYSNIKQTIYFYFTLLDESSNS